jgi:UDP-glucose 4-epimerase
VKVLVTGGAGFIGSHLCAELIARRIEVTVLDDFTTGRRENLVNLPVQVVKASVTNGKAVERAARDVDAVVHLAAIASVPLSIESPIRTHDVNVTGTLNVLQAARKSGAHVVVASSAAVYGNASGKIRADIDLPHPLSPYAASKLTTETYATSWQESYGLPTLALRFFNVFGPGQRPGDAYAAVVPAFAAAAVFGQPLLIHGDGKQTRDFISVDTVASLLADAVQYRVTSPSPIDVAHGRRISLLNLADMLEKILQRPLRREFMPARAGDIRHSSADGSAVRALFPRLRQTDLRVALEETVAWWRTQQPRFGPSKSTEKAGIVAA